MPTLSHLQLSLNPVLLDLGSFEIRYYGVLLTLSFILGYFWLIRAERSSILSEARRVEGLLDFFLITAVGGFLGAKIVYLILASFESSIIGNWKLEIGNLLSGGLSFHGGLLGGAFAAWLYAKRHKNFPLLQVADHLALFLPIGIILVRLGNLINQELVGPPTARPWGIIFSTLDREPRHPTPLYEALAAFLIGLILWGVHRSEVRQRRTKDGSLFVFFLLLYSAGRFLTDFFREQTVYSGLSLAQWASILVIVFSTTGLFRGKPRGG